MAVRPGSRARPRHAAGAEVSADGTWTNRRAPNWAAAGRAGAGGTPLEAAELRGLHPRWDDFTALRGELGPTGLFGSPAVDRVLGGV